MHRHAYDIVQVICGVHTHIYIYIHSCLYIQTLKVATVAKRPEAAVPVKPAEVFVVAVIPVAAVAAHKVACPAAELPSS